jgi:glycosyltransferase involved in cell wall biosynthesis
LLVSIIIPCYNQGAYIQDAIDSVIAQTYKNWEIIVVNDGSDNDETISILKEIESSGIQVLHIKNSGVSVARNIGIQQAKGEYILPLDADDKIGKDYLNEAIKVFASNELLKLVYCKCEYFGTKDGLLQVPNFSLQAMLFENLIFNAAVFKKKDFLLTAGYDSSFRIGWEDWDFWLSFIENETQVCKLDAVHFYYRIKADSRNNSLVNVNRIICEQQIFKKHIDKYLEIESNPITKLQEFNFYKTEYKKLEQYRIALYKSWSYRIGNATLFPFKIIKKLFIK